MMETRSDGELMALYQQGSLEAFNLLYSRYEKRIYNYFLRHLGDPERSAEIFQETWLRLHRDRQAYNPQFPFATWLFTIASNLAKNEFKQVSRRRRVFEGVEVDYEQVGDKRWQMDPGIVLERSEVTTRIEQALRLLPTSQREVIVMSKYQGLSYAEIAEITRTSIGAVKQKAHRALVALREHLHDLESAFHDAL
ncbi:MAG: sigma-70 family RNA polymerase sigma factor [Candidatus Latescibacteria bacterium]|nr:sigma-70 family RNA polymerase sigma factor [Candidatus Latescibacterota bacterium]